MTVVILEDAAEDIEAGRNFYESREAKLASISLSQSFRILWFTCASGSERSVSATSTIRRPVV